MPSYIEAGELLMELNDTDIFDTYNDYSMVIDTIDNFPTADVAPVRHGRWVIIEILCGGGKERKYYRCSECNKANVIRSNYCGNCGARMDGDADANGNDNKTPET